MKKQRGLSLSEVLISLFLSSLIIALLMQFYLRSKQQYQEAQAVLTSQLDLHWVRNLLSDSIRRAGFTPCLGLNQLKVRDLRPKPRRAEALAFRNQPVAEIVVKRMDEHFSLVKAMNSSQLILVNRLRLSPKRPIVIADCEYAEIHALIAVEKNTLSLERPMQVVFREHAYVGEFIEERWFVKKNKHSTPHLYYQAQQTEEITPLVHSLQIENKNLQGKPLIKIILGLADGKNDELYVAVRGT